MQKNKSSTFPRGIGPRGKNLKKVTYAAEPRGIRKVLDKREIIGRVAKAILITLAVGGVAATAVMAPNAVQLLKNVLKKKNFKFNDRALASTLRRLEENRFVEWVMKDGKEGIKITEKGKSRIRYFVAEKLELSIPPKWDRKWTLILYDIPEPYKRARDAFHFRMKELGCLQIHKSVFVHPSDCGDEMDYLSELFEVRKYVFHFRTQSLGKMERRSRHFFSFK